MRPLLHLAILAGKHAARHRLRSLLTAAGVAAGIFLYTAVETMRHSLRAATESSADDTTLVVYRENRYCPATSRLPEHFLADIRAIEGVREAIPVQVVVNNCGASLDVITFRGVPPGDLAAYNPDLEIVSGSLAAWGERQDAALLGEHFAARRALRPGDQFEAVGVRVQVAGVIRSPHPQDNNVAYVHLPFLQQSSRAGLGVVTQFNVRVDSPALLEEVAARIDERFRADTAPTTTRPEKAFFAQAAGDLMEMAAFSRWLAWGAALAVLALVANSLLLVARSRVKESAILQTIGYPQGAIALLMAWEGILVALAGGAAGSAGAALFFRWQRFTLGNEGQTLALVPSLEAAAAGLGLAALLGLLASLWPAAVAARAPVLQALRS